MGQFGASNQRFGQPAPFTFAHTPGGSSASPSMFDEVTFGFCSDGAVSDIPTPYPPDNAAAFGLATDGLDMYPDMNIRFCDGMTQNAAAEVAETAKAGPSAQLPRSPQPLISSTELWKKIYALVEHPFEGCSVWEIPIPGRVASCLSDEAMVAAQSLIPRELLLILRRATRQDKPGTFTRLAILPAAGVSALSLHEQLVLPTYWCFLVKWAYTATCCAESANPIPPLDGYMIQCLQKQVNSRELPSPVKPYRKYYDMILNLQAEGDADW